jgi:glucose-6-phosphate 1-dehydrogenase
MTALPCPPGVFVIFGGTGDLARRKILPALWALRREGRIDDRVLVLGVTRDTAMTDDAFRQLVLEAVASEDERDAARDWCDRAVYYAGTDDGDGADFARLARRIEDLEAAHDIPANRAFYLALPPIAFTPTIDALGRAGLNRSSGWTRLVVEKPFGRDHASALALNATVHRWFDEAQVYRIDHYLGKETVQNLLVFRFANAVFESLWSRDHVRAVQITVAEDLGIGTRAGYYDRAGVVRDIVQNHAAQLLAIVAMEVPTVMDAASIRAEKIKALKAVRPPSERNIVLGQYRHGQVNGHTVPSYLEERGVPPESRTPTYAALQLEVDSWRWQGVPFHIRSGKRLARRLTEIVLVFRRPPVWLFEPLGGCEIRSNILRLTIQPDEGFTLLVNAKAPGQPLALERFGLDFDYAEKFAELPDAYHTLLLEIMEGDQTLFVHADEVATAWNIVAPALAEQLPVHPYAAGGWGPAESDELIARRHEAWFNP